MTDSHDPSADGTRIMRVNMDNLQDVLDEHRTGDTVCIAELQRSDEGSGILFSIAPEWAQDPNGPVVTGILMQFAYEVSRAATNRLEQGSDAERKMLEAQLAMLDAARAAGVMGNGEAQA